MESLQTNANRKDLNDQDLYEPKFFIKEVTVDPTTGIKSYHYKPDGQKYWEKRETGDWDEDQRIYDHSD